MMTEEATSDLYDMKEFERTIATGRRVSRSISAERMSWRIRSGTGSHG